MTRVAALILAVICGVAVGVTSSPSSISSISSISTSTSTNTSSYSISSGPITIGVNVSSDGSVYIATFYFAAAGANTTNLARSLGSHSTQGGSTLVAPPSSSSLAASVPLCLPPQCTVIANTGSISLTGLSLSIGGSVVATESWSFNVVNSSSVRWEVSRSYSPTLPASSPSSSSSPLTLQVDRLGITFQTTGGLPIHGNQVPSFLALDMFLNNATTSGYDIGNSAFEYLVPSSPAGGRQTIRFGPTGALFLVTGEASYNNNPYTPLFSFAKPFADGTTWCNLGFEGIDPRQGSGSPRIVSPGDSSTFSLTLTLLSDNVPAPPGTPDPFPALDISLPNATLAGQIATLMGAQYQLAGWLFGNNPASVSCLHEAVWWPLVSGLLPAGSPALTAMQQELSFFLECGWQSEPWTTGDNIATSCVNNFTAGALYGLQQRFGGQGFYTCPWGPLQDQNVEFIIAVYYTAAATGDMEWLASLRPALDTLVQYLASRGLVLPASRRKGGEVEEGAAATGASSSANPPVVFVAPTSGIADGGRHASNWYDVVEFGNLDSYLAVHGVWSMGCLAEIYAALGDSEAASLANQTHAAAVVDFNRIFWNESASAYHDWIDSEGNARSYFYADTAFTAIIAGVANATQTSALLAHYDARLQDIYAQYIVPAGNIWSPPCSLYPFTNKLEYIVDQGPLAFPQYEQGGSFFHTAGLQLAALGAAGRADEAFAAFTTIMNSGFGEIRGWAQQLYWGPTNTLVGFDPLNTALLSVWGFLRTGFGVTPTLSNGLVVVNAPPAAMEGARWNVSLTGSTVCLEVKGGVAQFCNGTALR